MIRNLLFILLGCVVLFFALYCQFCNAIRQLKKIPGPKGWPVIGNGLEVMCSNDELLRKLKKIKNKYGDLIRVWSLHVRVAFIYHPNDAEKILSSKKFAEKPALYALLKPWLCEGLFLSNGKKWHQRRKMLTPAFHFSILKEFMKTFVNQTNLLVVKLQQEVGKERTDPADLVPSTMLKILCETAMCTDIVEENKEKVQRYFDNVQIFIECMVYRATRVALHLNWIYHFTMSRQVRDNAVKELHEFTKKIIKNRIIYRQNLGQNRSKITDDGDYGNKPTAMLDLLLENANKAQIDEVGVREEIDSFMFAGHDTISTAIGFFLMCIANEEEYQARIYEELKTIFGDDDRDPTISDINDMNFLECCIKESLRLYPSVPRIARILNEDVPLGGYTVPAGTMCAIEIFEIHRRADFFPEPERFLPERFLPENINIRNNYAFIPFSAGPRNCIGQKYSKMAMKTTLSGILRKFRLEPVTKPEELEYTAHLILRTKDPFYVRVTNRTKTE